MKQSEIKKCASCDKGVMHTGLPLFWRVKVERFGVDLRAVQRQHGLEMMVGGHAAIAAALGPNEDIAKPIGEEVEFILCEECILADRFRGIAMTHERLSSEKVEVTN